MYMISYKSNDSQYHLLSFRLAALDVSGILYSLDLFVHRLLTGIFTAQETDI
jgi:hypothetical protein